MGKPYDVGMVCGRFQTLHRGHEKLFETSLLLCDRLLVLVGSAQECDTERNPYNINTRTMMLKELYGDNSNVMIYGLTDMTNENDICYDWGRYLLWNVKRYIYKNPELMVYGNDESRNGWFDRKDLKGTTQLMIDRYDDGISATEVRRRMAIDDREGWMGLVNPRLHKFYDILRSELMTVEFYKELGRQELIKIARQKKNA